jgi:uncharacterized protein involved in exopolysaccharide biosynthesis
MTSDPISNVSAETDASINLGQIYSLILRQSWLIAAGFLAAVFLAILYLFVATPLYESTAVLEIQKQQQLVYTPADNSAKNEDETSDETEVKTIEQALQLDGLYEATVSDPAIVVDEKFLASLGFSPGATPSKYDIGMRLKKATQIKLLHGTRLISVSVDNPNAAIAQLLTSTLVNTFIAQNGRSQTDTTKTAMSFLEGETARFKADLQKAQDALQVYGEALQLKDQITDQQKVVMELSQRYRAKHPKLIQARSELTQLEARFDSNINAVVANSPAEAAYWDATMKSLSTAPMQDRVEGELKLVEARTNVLQREGDTQSALFDNVLKQMREADIGKENAPVSVDVVQPAPLPERPSKPQKLLILALAAMGGAALGVMAIFVSHALDSSLKTVDEVEQLLNLSVLGSLPLLKGTNTEGGGNRPGSKKSKTAPVTLSFYRNLVLLNDPEGKISGAFGRLSNCWARRRIIGLFSFPAPLPMRAKPSRAATMRFPWPSKV